MTELFKHCHTQWVLDKVLRYFIPSRESGIISLLSEEHGNALVSGLECYDANTYQMD